MSGNIIRIIATVCPNDQALDSVATWFRERIVSVVTTRYIQKNTATKGYTKFKKPNLD